MLYRWEPLTYMLKDGLEALGARSWSEIGLDKELFKYSPNWKRYQAMETENILRFMAVRDDSMLLVGYAAVIIVENLHDYRITSAYIQDAYLEPESRKGIMPFKGLIDEICTQLAGLHVDHICIGERENDPRGGIGSVYKRLGFQSDERIWRKTLRKVEK